MAKTCSFCGSLHGIVSQPGLAAGFAPCVSIPSRCRLFRRTVKTWRLSQRASQYLWKLTYGSLLFYFFTFRPAQNFWSYRLGSRGLPIGLLWACYHVERALLLYPPVYCSLPAVLFPGVSFTTGNFHWKQEGRSRRGELHVPIRDGFADLV